MNREALKDKVRSLTDPKVSDADKAAAKSQLRGVGAQFASVPERRQASTLERR